MILVSHLELVWWRMSWKFVNAQVTTGYALTIFPQAANCSQTWIRRVSGLLEPWESHVMKYRLIDRRGKRGRGRGKKRKERGSYDYRSDGKIEIVWWNDNSVLTFKTNAYSVEPIRTVKRWVKGIGKSNVNHPAVIAA